MDGSSGHPAEQGSPAVGAAMREWRLQRGLSLVALGKEVSYSPGHLSKMENGKKRISRDLARRVDEVLDTGGALIALLPDERSDTTGADVCPYPGLVAFGPQDAQWFFGREQATADLVRRLDEHLAAAGPLAVVAPSGAGKSSLLSAGLIPALASGSLPSSRDWPVVCATPGTDPLPTLVNRITAQTGTDPTAATAIAGDPDRFAAFLTEVIADTGPVDNRSLTRIVLIIDQFEEIFTECQEETERQAFIAALCTAAHRAAALVVLGVRADFYGHCLTYPALLPTLQAPVALGPMSAEQIREVITRPAQAEGLDLEPGLVELLLRDLGVTEDAGVGGTSYDPGALPLLAHALRVTWQQRDNNTLTVAGYRRTGGIHQALATTAEDVYTKLSPAEQQIARQVLLRLVHVSDQEGSGDTRRRLPRARLVEALPLPGSVKTVDTVLEVFGRARLLTLDTDSVEITHEALLRAWPRLRQWIDTDRAGNLIRQELEEAAASWERDRSDTAGLYRGSRLEAARTWAGSHAHKGELSPAASAFVAASTAQEHRAARLRRTVLVLLSVLALVASAGVVVTLHQTGVAQRERDTATFNQITAQADRLRSTDVSLAAQLDLVAYRMQRKPDLYTALVTLGNGALSTPLTGHTGYVDAVAFSPDGRTLASGSADQTVRLWNLADSAHPSPLGQPLAGHTDAVHTVAFSPNGHILATGSYDHTVRLWNVADPAHATPLGQPLIAHTDIVYAVAFSPDGHTLASASGDRTVRLWDVADPAHPTPLGQPLIDHTDSVFAVAFSPDGHTLATGSYDRTVRLWNVADPAHPTPLGQPLIGHTDHVTAVAFSPDGHTLATGSSDDTVRLWNVADPVHPSPLGQPLAGQNNLIFGVAFSPDGHTLASASYDQTVWLWNVADPAHPTPLGQPLTGHTKPVFAVAFSPDGHTLASASADHTVRLWNIPYTLTTGHTNQVIAVAFTRNGQTLASGSLDHTVRLWNVADPAHPTRLGQPLTGHTNQVNDVAFSPDGHILASASGDRTVRLWNVADPAHPTPLGQPLTEHTNSVSAVAFSRDGRTLATGSNDHTIRLWNVADPAHPTPLGQPLTEHTNSVSVVAFSPDGRILASGSADQTVRLWNVADPVHPTQVGQPLTGHSNQVIAVTFSRDGRTLATGSNDQTVRLWNVADPVHPTQVGQPLTGHTHTVSAVAFSRDGRTLATGSLDQTVRLWNVADPTHPTPTGQPLTGYTNQVIAAAFSPDGHTLATGSADHTVRLWETNVDQAIQRICAATPNTLTLTKWEQYVSPDLPYRPPCE